MRDLYDRLKEAGFDATFVRDRLLPDWWDDSLAAVPSNRAMAEIALSRSLGFSIADLRSSEAKLKLPAATSVRLKRRAGTATSKMLPAIHLARRVSALIVSSVAGLSAYAPAADAAAVRDSILESHEVVDLESLLSYAWEHGVAVMHLSSIPKPSKKFSAACFFDTRPTVVLASGRDSDPWLAFHLAHELGHLFLGHISQGGGLADLDIDKTDTSADERAANEFACEVLTGDPRPSASAIYGLTGLKLAGLALQKAGQERIDAGVFALVYGRNANRIPVAQVALKTLGRDRGARKKVASALRARLPADIPETTGRLLALATTE